MKVQNRVSVEVEGDSTTRWHVLENGLVRGTYMRLNRVFGDCGVVIDALSKLTLHRINNVDESFSSSLVEGPCHSMCHQGLEMTSNLELEAVLKVDDF